MKAGTLKIRILGSTSTGPENGIQGGFCGGGFYVFFSGSHPLLDVLSAFRRAPYRSQEMSTTRNPIP
jgi:hypothetical protein